MSLSLGRTQRDAGDDGGSGGGQARCRGRRSRGTGDLAAGEPLNDDDLDADANVDAGAATKEGSKLSASLPGQNRQALTASEEAKSTTEVNAESSDNGLAQEAGDVDEEATDEVKGSLGGSGERQPEQDNGLQLNTQTTLGAGQPDSEVSADIDIEGGSELATGAGLKALLNVNIQVDRDVGLEESTNGSLGAGGQSTALLDGSANGGTNGDSAQSISGEVAGSNEAAVGLAVDPGENGSLEVDVQRAVLAVQPGEKAGLDVGVQAAHETASSASLQTSLDVNVKTNGGVEEASKGSLEVATEDEGGLEVRSREDTVNGNVDGFLGGDLGAAGDVDSQCGQDIALESGGRTVTPGVKLLEQSALDVDLGGQPGLQLLTGRSVNDAGLAAKSTTLKSGSTVGTEAGEEGSGAVDINTQDGIEETTNVDHSRAENIRTKTEGAAVDGQIVGRVGEGRAHQAGEQEEGGTHGSQRNRITSV